MKNTIQRIMIIAALGLTSGLQGSTRSSRTYHTIKHGAELVSTISSITALSVFIMSIKYRRKANQIIKKLEEQVDTSDADTATFIKNTIAGLKKGKKLILTTLGTNLAAGLLINPSYFTNDSVAGSYIESSSNITKGAIASYYAQSINKDIAMVTKELAKEDDAEDALDIEHLDEALQVLRFGRTLALTIAITNGIDTAMLVSSPLWRK
jgi:predicted Zn-dependent peptidase